MKNFAKLAVAMAAVLLCFSTLAVRAQNNRKARKAQHDAAIKNLIDSGKYIFVANYATTATGMVHYLTSDYALQFGKDTLDVYLPYFGRVYIAPMDLTEVSTQFISTNFEHYLSTSNNGGWELVLLPKDVKHGQKLQLIINHDGYASLKILANDRDPIDYQGYITDLKRNL